MNLLLWMLAGVIISIITTRYFSDMVRGGLVGAVFLGIFGAIQGGFISNLMLDSSLFYFDMPSLFIAMASTLCFLGLGKAFSVDLKGQPTEGR